MHRYELEVGGRLLTIEAGQLAQQASGSVLVRYGDTVVLVTAVAGGVREGIDFLPLTVDYEERLYAAGRIPGSFFRREGRPTTEAVLAGRLTDRTIRPRFPKGIRNDIQIISTVLSVDGENAPEVLSIIGASAALSVSQIPFDGPIAGTRMGRVNGEFVVNPTYQQLVDSDLDLTVSGSREAMIMVEAGANEVSEQDVLEALRIGQEANVAVVELQDRMVSDFGKAKRTDWLKPAPDDEEALNQAVADLAKAKVQAVIDKGEARGERSGALSAAEAEATAQLGEQYGTERVTKAFDNVVKKVVRAKILDAGRRPDGRDLTEVRPLSSMVGLIPRTHGSALFQRGETQILTLTTLGPMSMEQRLDSLSPDDRKRYIHHYNFPPFSTGEVRRIGTGRREIGHGALAERALAPVIPDEVEFPYALRLVSEALGSNGSTSMGSVCGSTLSLMDAGVPIKAPVSGVAMGLITDDDGRFAILTDIQGVEDFMGDMDFKVAGTPEGITALQMDIKVSGLTPEIMRTALHQAKEGRAFILHHMLGTLAEPREELSAYAPRMVRISIPVDKIGAVIGPGGKTIRSITEESGASVDIDNDGTVTIGSMDEAAAAKAITMIEGLTKEVQVGEVYTGPVTRIMNFGAFVEILPGKDGLVHISEISSERVPSVEAAVTIGDEMTVMVTEIDRMGRVNLSRRAVLEGDDYRPIERERRGPPERGNGDRRDRGPRGDRNDRGPRDRNRDRGERGPRRDRY